MKLEYKDCSYITDNGGEPAYLARHVNPHYILHSELGYQVAYIEYKGVRITQELLDTYFEPVENFTEIRLSKRERSLEKFYPVHKHIALDLFIKIGVETVDYDPEDEEEYENIHENPKGVYEVFSIFYKGDDEVNLFVDSLNKIFEFSLNNKAKVSIVLKTMSGFQFKKCEIRPLPIDIDVMYNDDFKPVYDRVVDKLKNTDKGVVLFHGEPGTGKTNLIKNLTTVVGDKNFVFIPSHMISALTDPGFIGQLVENKGSILVLEDCENYIKDRKLDGNDSVSSLLNLTDGIMSDILSIQIICTFNGDIGNIDPALLRKGRLIAEYKFEQLAPAKVAKLIGNTAIEGKPTLANILNAQESQLLASPQRAAIGFGRSK